MWSYETSEKARKHYKGITTSCRFCWIVCCILLALFYLFLLLSCSAARHVDRAVMKESPKYVIDYTIGKYGDSYLPRLKDTLIDTIYVVGTHIDTFKITNKIDTIILSKDNVITKVFRHYDTIWVSTDVKTDTIVRVVYRDRYVIKPEDARVKSIYHNLSMWLDIFLIVVVILATILLLLRLNK